MTNFYEDMRKSLNAKRIPEKALSAFEIAQTKGFNGNEIEWLNSLKGNDGLSAWEVAIAKGYNGSEDDWLKSLQGKDGRSAYLVWRDIHGGTAEEFVASMKGLPGKRGDSAYEIWKRVTKSTGTEKDFIEYLKGEPGDTIIYAPTFVISDDGELIMEVNGERQNLGKVRPDFANAVASGGDMGSTGSGSLRIVHFTATGALPATGKAGIIYVERGVGAFVWDAETASMVSISAGGATFTPSSTIPTWNAAEAVQNSSVRLRTVAGESAILTSNSARTTGSAWDLTELSNWKLCAQSGFPAFATGEHYPSGFMIKEGPALYRSNTDQTGGISFAADVANWTVVIAASGSGNSIIQSWAANVPVVGLEARTLPGVGADFLGISFNTRTTNATFDLAEAGEWQYVSQSAIPVFTPVSLYVQGYMITDGATIYRRISNGLSLGSFALDAANWATILGLSTAGAIAFNWAASTPVLKDELRTFTGTQLTQLNSASDFTMRSKLARTTGATASTTELANWELVGQRYILQYDAAGTYPAGSKVCNIARTRLYTALADIASGGTGPGVDSNWLSLTDGAPAPIIRTFAANGSYTPTAGIKSVVIELQGGGGGGATSATASGTEAAGGGGGAGGYIKTSFTAAQIGAGPHNVVIGSGGGSSASGGDSTLGGTIMVANGGSPGNAAANGQDGMHIGGNGGGTSMSTGTQVEIVTGQSGGHGWTAGGFRAHGGDGGSSKLGHGGRGALQLVTNSQNSGSGGTGRGSGGGGGAASNTTGQGSGGVGQPGYCIITEYL